MKVRELLEELRDVNPEAEVIISKDAEGNDHSPLASMWEGAYKADTTWMGEVGFAAMTPELRGQGYDDEDVIDGVPALILAIIPDLTCRGQAPYPAKRQAGFLLTTFVLLIALIAQAHASISTITQRTLFGHHNIWNERPQCPPHFDRSLNRERHRKSSSMVENIEILCAPPYVNPPALVCKNSVQFCWFDCLFHVDMSLGRSVGGDHGHTLRFVEIYGIFFKEISGAVDNRENLHLAIEANTIGRRLAGVEKFDNEPMTTGSARIKSETALLPWAEVSTQLLFGGFFGPAYQIPSGVVEKNSSEKKKESESRNEAIRDLEPIAHQRRPELGSLFSAILSLALGFWLGVIAHQCWRTKKRVAGAIYFSGCIVLGLWGTFGLLLGLDLWSLWRML